MRDIKKKSLFQFSPFALLVHGLLIIPAFLLQGFLLFRIFQTLLFFILSLCMKKKGNLLFSLFSFLFIVLFNINTPHGEVLIHLCSFPITKQAIENGVFKATTFIGLLSLSKMTIMKDLTITGPIGGMIGKVFYYFEQLEIVRKKYKTKDIFKRIDMILLEVTLFPGKIPDEGERTKKELNLAGVILLILSVLFHWGLLGISLFAL